MLTGGTSHTLPERLTSSLDSLLRSSENPTFAFALSGGGDSTGVLHALKDHPGLAAVWIVDHALREDSDQDALQAKAFAESLGLKAEILVWQHEDPKSGIQEKARRGRYALLGEACRVRGISHLLTAHTKDDQAETLLMRYERGTHWRGAAGMAEVTYAPLWPELAGITVLRPALDISRAELRAYNSENGLTWINDPANRNTDFARIRARKELRERPELAADLLKTSAALREGRETERRRLLAIARRHVRIDDEGLIYTGAQMPLYLLEIILQAASGRGEPVKQAQLQNLHRDMTAFGFSGATLAGARVSPHKDGYVFSRDIGGVTGRSGVPALKPEGLSEQTILWDGRYWICARRTGLSVKPLGHMRVRLNNENHAALQAVPHFARAALPAVVAGNALLALGTVIAHPDVDVTSAVREHVEGRLGGTLSA